MIRHGYLPFLCLGLWAQGVRPWQVGFQLGFNIPAYRSSERVAKAVVTPGGSAGLQIRYALTSRLAVQTGLYYNQRVSSYLVVESYREDTTVGMIRDEYVVYVENDGKLTLAHLELPILAEWNIVKGENYRSYFLGGVHAGYRLFARNVGTTRVLLEGLDFLPLFGFPPKTRVVVEEQQLDPKRVVFKNGDFGLWAGGGNAYRMGKGEMTFEIRAFTGLINIFRQPRNQQFYNGSVMFMLGYLF
ncbi:MAG: PorT family protein [Bacteroidia bacterium]|nr:PorT family protein [Bacteroidia bacterium]MDW8235191.1 porin family protein [Bacteroidia bacterium]